MGRFIPNENSFIGFTLGPIGVMPAPAGVTAIAAPGTIPASTVSYVVTAYNQTGETAGSTAASLVLAAAGGATLTWSAVPGADGYRVYGRSATAGGHKLLVQLGNALTWTDSGAAVPQVTVPPTAGTASNLDAPSVADVHSCIELTEFVSGINFAAQGNVVPTPNLKQLFETSIEGTSQATATMDCYRDDEIDAAWEALPRRTKGFIFVTRFGNMPDTPGDHCEVWPIRVSSRTNANLTNNTPATFTLTFAVVQSPAEDAVVVA
jgi:hypothetical protein